MNNKLFSILAVILGIVFIIIGIIYLIEPAKSLPQFFPGYDASLIKHHYKHGLGALILGLACFIFVWFKTGKNHKSV